MATKYISLLPLVCLLLLFSTCKESFIPPTSPCVAQEDIIINPAHPKAAALQAKIDEYIGKGLPGITLLISDDDGVWFNAGGFADLENRVPLNPCHISKLGSVTKMMLGTLVWQLIQEGVLGIDDPISQYIPGVAEQITNGSEITLAMLLNHSSGIYDVAGDLDFNLAVINDFSRSWTEEEILPFLENKPATHAPGTAVKYSNSNTMLVGMVLDAAAGKPHSQLLQERLYGPLGMNNTVYYDYAESFPYLHLAQGYLDFNNDGKAIQNISNLNPGSGNGYTGVYSTVTDLYRFMKALLRDRQLTSDENLDRIFDSMRLAESGSFRSSLGAIHDEYLDMLSDTTPAYGHTGGDIGYSANLSYLPHNNTIFAATYNYGTNLETALGNELRQLRDELYVILAQ